MNTKARLLKNHPVFGQLSLRTLRKLTANASIDRHFKGDTIYKAGDNGDALYVVLSGRCQSFAVLADGPAHTLNIYGPGDTFGERALLSDDTHWSTVRVITDSVLLRIDGEDVRTVLSRNQAVARHFAGRMRDQLQRYREDPSSLRHGRVAAFASLSPNVNGSLIVDSIAYGLKEETGTSVLSVHIAAGHHSPTLADWHRMSEADGVGFAFADQVERVQTNWDVLRIVADGEEREAEWIASLISHLARQYRYVIIHVAHEVADAVALEFLVQSDLAYALLQQTGEDLYRTNLLVRQYQSQSSGELGDVWPVICLRDGERANPLPEYRRQLGVSAHAVLHGLPGKQAGEFVFEPHLFETRFGAHIRMIEREIGRCRIGLALSSGGAKGMAHVGVIQVLEENGIHVDAIAGSSMGAYIGALWAYGLSGAEIRERSRQVENRWTLWRLIDPAFPPRRGFMRGRRLKAWLEKSIADAHFSDLMRQLRVVATDLETLERVVFESGRISDAVLASMAMPGVVVPVEHDGRTLIDGGIADPLPVDVLMEMGVERIIAVNTIPNPEELKYCVQVDREQAAVPQTHHHLLPAVNRRINYFARGNILDILIRSIHGASTRVAEGAGKQADVVLRPVSCDGVWHDFARSGHYIELGRRAAEEHLQELKDLSSASLHTEIKPAEERAHA